MVAFPTTGRQTFAVQAIYTQHLAGDYVVTLAGAAPNFPQRLDFQIYAKLAPGVSPSAGRQAIEALLVALPQRQAHGPGPVQGEL